MDRIFLDFTFAFFRFDLYHLQLVIAKRTPCLLPHGLFLLGMGFPFDALSQVHPYLGRSSRVRC